MYNTYENLKNRWTRYEVQRDRFNLSNFLKYIIDYQLDKSF
jgi:hypothetical protein